jgi:hypothetical protein
MLGLISIDLPFLENLRSNWVVVIGLELLSLTCPGLDLGTVMLHHITYVILVTVMVMLILLVRNRGMVWVKLRWLEPTRHKRVLLGGCDAPAGGETSVGTLQSR